MASTSKGSRLDTNRDLPLRPMRTGMVEDLANLAEIELALHMTPKMAVVD